jgi:ribosomal protein S18 acetylase RimI-like enzyme
LLFDLSRQSYTDSFANHWNAGGLAWYLNKVYNKEDLTADLFDHEISYFIAFYDGEPAGFMKLKLRSNLLDDETEGLEVEKIYFKNPYQGKGMGTMLLLSAIEIARQLKKKEVWLGVLDTNVKALKLYERMGFVLFDKTRLELPYLKEELKGMWRMVLKL